MQWSVIAEIEAKEAFAPLTLIRNIFGIVFLFMMILVWLMGVLVSRVIAGPIRKLRLGTEIVGSGNLDYKVGIDSNDEVGQLSRAFDEMTNRLKDSVTWVEKLNKEVKERKKIQEYFSALVTNVPGVIYRCANDKDWTMEFISDEVHHLTGYPAQDFIGNKVRTYESIIYPEDRPLVNNTIQESVKLSIPYSIEYRIIDSRKNVKWVHEQGCGIFEDNTGLLSLNGAIFDITNDKNNRIELAERKEWLDTALNSIGDAVITTDSNGMINFINPIAQELTGWGQGEASGRHIEEVFVIKTEDTGEKAVNPVITVISSGKISKLANHTVLIAKDGKRRAIDDSAAPIKKPDDNQIVGVVLVFRDVTERNEREKRLQELSVAVEQSPACVVITDIKGNIQYVNHKFIQLTGYSFKEVAGLNPRILKSGEQSAEFYKNLWGTITSGEDWHGEFHNKKKNGELYWESASISPIRGKDGVITNFLAVKEDVTERKKLERLKDDFVSTISHELRTPLTAIKEGINIVSDGSAGLVNEEQLEFLGIAKRNVDRLSRLINEILDFQKFESGRMVFNISENKITDVAREVWESMSIVASSKGLRLLFEAKDDLPKIKFDKDKITQVITNLVSNAIKFTKEGSITILVEKVENTIKVSVRDTGSGMRQEDLVKLFQKFVQLEGLSDRKTGGTGLGLAISKDIIDGHRGKIWAESELGKGSVFSFILPIEERRRFA